MAGPHMALWQDDNWKSRGRQQGFPAGHLLANFSRHLKLGVDLGKCGNNLRFIRNQPGSPTILYTTKVEVGEPD